MNDTRRFHLDRRVDVTGASGTGYVADGVVWPDGTVTVRWRGERCSTVNWDRLEDAEAIHGYGGATRIVWDDERPVLPEWLQLLAAGKRSTADAWAEVSGYVAGLVEEGSADAEKVLAFMHELKPSTRVFTGSAEDLRGESA